MGLVGEKIEEEIKVEKVETKEVEKEESTQES